MPKETIKLNASQRKAVEFKDGSLLVVAGAGTGKTRVITQRIKRLIEKEKVSPKEILALTFTEKASQEMVDRVGDVMPLGYEEPWINTFHNFAQRLLRLEGLEIGLDPSFKILSGPEQWILFRKNIFNFELKYFRPRGNPTKFISAILTFISRLQDENISPEEFSKYAEEFKGDKEEKERWEELAKTFEKYQELKMESSYLDFGDLITWSIKLFKERPNILKKYQKQFKHMLVDEFQDTNHAQYELVKLLVPAGELKERSLLVVGDDSQSIYKFRGAAVSNILEFRDDYKDSEMVTLLENYRSTQQILDPAYKLIKNNNPDTLESKLKISKELVSPMGGKGDTPQILRVETIEGEVDLVVKRILEILANESEYTYKDIAILARANNHLTPFIFALRKYGLPYQLVGNRGLYDREEVRDVLALLKVVVDPMDGMSLYRVLNIGSFEVDHNEISFLLSSARKERIPLWDKVEQTLNPEVINLRKTIAEFQELITKLSPSEFVYRLVSQIHYVEEYLVEETVENHMSIRNLDLFLNKVKQFEIGHQQDTNETPTIVDLLDYLELLIEAGENPAQAEIEDIDTINLMTVHSSKGLEFPVVFMVNLIGGRFPTRNRKDAIDMPDELVKETLPTGDAHIQEERRLFYVGMTRAEKYLHLMLSKNYGGKRDSVPSGYLGEVGIEITDVLEEETKKPGQVGLFGLESGFREPKVEKIKEFKPRFLSYSQYNTYNTCPLRYKYSYVLGVPTPPNHAFSFGNSIHNTLNDFHSMQKAGKEVDLEKLFELYKGNWEPAGYLSKEHRETSFENGKKVLEKYYEDNKDLKVEIIGLEKSFNIWIGGTKFYGRIDRIDKLPEGGAEIIDFKTGQAKDQKYVDKDDQVTFYALGVKEALGMNPEKMSLYFVETGEKVSTTRAPEQLEAKKKDVAEVVEKIKTADFKAKPGMHCNWCAHRDICPQRWKK